MLTLMTVIDSQYENMLFKLVLIKLFCCINKPVEIPLVYAE